MHTWSTASHWLTWIKSTVPLGGTEKWMLIPALINGGYKGTQSCHNSNRWNTKHRGRKERILRVWLLSRWWTGLHLEEGPLSLLTGINAITLPRQRQLLHETCPTEPLAEGSYPHDAFWTYRLDLLCLPFMDCSSLARLNLPLQNVVSCIVSFMFL